jgi:hypothetical protein
VIHVGKMASTRRKCKGVDTKLILKPFNTGCPSGQTPHHLIPDRCTTGMPGYSHGTAPCICVKGSNQHTGSHRACHRVFDPVERWHYENNKPFKYSTARNAAAKSAGGALTPKKNLTKKEQECIKAQLDEYYKAKPQPGLTANSPLNKSGAPGKVNELFPTVQASGGGIPSPV